MVSAVEYLRLQYTEMRRWCLILSVFALLQTEEEPAHFFGMGIFTLLSLDGLPKPETKNGWSAHVMTNTISISEKATEAHLRLHGPGPFANPWSSETALALDALLGETEFFTYSPLVQSGIRELLYCLREAVEEALGRRDFKEVLQLVVSRHALCPCSRS